jgi:hypothetical protein
MHRYSEAKAEFESDNTTPWSNTAEINTCPVPATSMESTRVFVGGEEVDKTDTMSTSMFTRTDHKCGSSPDTGTYTDDNGVRLLSSISGSDSLDSSQTLTPTPFLAHCQPGPFISPTSPPLQPACPATTSTQSPLSLTKRLFICAFHLLGLLTAIIFGVWTIKSYNVSVEALQVAKEANQIGLLGFCASELEGSGDGSFANRRFGRGCREVFRAFKGLGFEEVVRGAGLNGEGDSKLVSTDTLQMQISVSPNPFGKAITTMFCHGCSENSSRSLSMATTANTASPALASSWISTLSQPSQSPTTTVTEAIPARNLPASPHLHTLSSLILEEYSRSTTLPSSPAASHLQPSTNTCPLPGLDWGDKGRDECEALDLKGLGRVRG